MEIKKQFILEVGESFLHLLSMWIQKAHNLPYKKGISENLEQKYEWIFHFNELVLMKFFEIIQLFVEIIKIIKFIRNILVLNTLYLIILKDITPIPEVY